MKNRKIALVLLCGIGIAIISTITILVLNIGKSTENNNIDITKTQLYVYSYDGGIGTEWLDDIAMKFQNKYAGISFEDGKKGVEIIISRGKDNPSALASSIHNVFFEEQIYYNDFISQGLVLDISDIIKGSLSEISEGKENGTIEDKLFDEQKTALTALDGKYYVLPHYECYSGISYDKDVFKNYELYFKDGNGFTSNDYEKSVGPDGIRNTGDDGLPSSYEEFYALLDKMIMETVIPFIWTGQYTSYINNLVTGLWAAHAGKDQFMLNVNFDSNINGYTTLCEVIKNFDENNLPQIEQCNISLANGYLTTQQAARYYALSMLEKIFSTSSYYSPKINGVLSHLDAQTEFIYSSLENKPIAMIIEGSYWYNEAKDALKRSANTYKSKAENRNFAWMELPRQLTGQVKEGQGTKNTLIDSLSAFGFINSNISNDPVKVKVAKSFLQYCYTDEAMQNFTLSTGIAKALKYQLTNEQYNSMCNYFKNVYNIRYNSDIIHPYANNKIYINAQAKFNFAATGHIWNSVVSGTTYSSPYNAFRSNLTAKDYFIGLKVNEYNWKKNYEKYFE